MSKMKRFMELQGSLVLLISYRMVEGREEKKMQFVALWHNSL
jgi:hypothetical protein